MTYWAVAFNTIFSYFFFNDTATTEIYTLSLHDALPISGDGGFFADARAPLDAVSQAVGFDFASLPDAEGVDTIGGLVTAVAGRVPNRGEILTGPGEFEFEVLDADPRRIKRLKIWPLSARGLKPAEAPIAIDAKPRDPA